MDVTRANNSTEGFYKSLPVLDAFSAVSNIENYSAIPADWSVIVADVVDSTGAIEKGLYKEVNMVGVSVITAITNLAKPVVLPLVFGGDGASLCIPNRLVAEARQALLAVRHMAAEAYALQLRVGVVPVSKVLDGGYKILVARHRVSPHYVQAAFWGGGMEYVEDLLKDKVQGVEFRMETDTETVEADLSGLECRWNHIPSRHGETISLLVKVVDPSEQSRATIYQEVISTVVQIYGDAQQSHPVTPEQLHLTLNSQKLSVEIRARVFPGGWFSYFCYWLFIRMQTMLGSLLMTFGISLGSVQWGNYKKAVAANTDYRKFDGMLREVLAGSLEQRKQLTTYLERRYESGELVYGIHTSESALMTCLISERSGEHFHFVDGSDGGYALAAVGLKQQLKTLSKLQS